MTLAFIFHLVATELTQKARYMTVCRNWKANVWNIKTVYQEPLYVHVKLISIAFILKRHYFDVKAMCFMVVGTVTSDSCKSLKTNVNLHKGDVVDQIWKLV